MHGTVSRLEYFRRNLLDDKVRLHNYQKSSFCTLSEFLCALDRYRPGDYEVMVNALSRL